MISGRKLYQCHYSYEKKRLAMLGIKDSLATWLLAYFKRRDDRIISELQNIMEIFVNKIKFEIVWMSFLRIKKTSCWNHIFGASQEEENYCENISNKSLLERCRGFQYTEMAVSTVWSESKAEGFAISESTSASTKKITACAIQENMVFCESMRRCPPNGTRQWHILGFWILDVVERYSRT